MSPLDDIRAMVKKTSELEPNNGGDMSEDTTPDGWLEVTFNNNDKEYFTFSSMDRGWKWNTDTAMLIISYADDSIDANGLDIGGRYEIPMLSIKHVKVVRNSDAVVNARRVAMQKEG